MTFTVTYREKSGAKAEMEIEAASRAECVAACKRRGIAPVGIREGRASSRPRAAETAAPHDGGAKRRGGTLWRAAILAATCLVSGIGAWWMLGSRGKKAILTVDLPTQEKSDGPRKVDPPKSTPGGGKGEAFVVPELTTAGNAQANKAGMERPAKPEARAQLRGTEARIERAKARGDRRIFVHDSECYLSNFAIPGEQVPPTPFEQNMVDDLMKALDEPINIDMSEDSETDIQMKNIVQGMKDEIKEYLKGGGTIENYLAELQKRQDREANYYSEAFAMVNKSAKEDDPAMAYELWKKTNEHLQSQGIRTMPLPRRLRNYERNL